MTKRLHTRTKIFFPNPYVVRLEYPGATLESAGDDFRKLCRKAYRLIDGTWGHSKLDYEQSKKADAGPSVPLHIMSPAGHQVVNINALFQNDIEFVPRAYFCFKDELDVLQFRLTVEARAIQVKMWPEQYFTIHEVVETDES
jgi:hypothetical protein